MSNRSTLLALLLLLGLIALGQPPSRYYLRAEGKTGTALKAALNDIITENHRALSYAEVYDVLKSIDQDPLNPENVLCIYAGLSMNAQKKDDNSKGWNREHIWPKSYGDFGIKKGAGTDLHHIRAADHSTNSARNNRNFDYSERPYVDQSGNYQGPTRSRVGQQEWTWEPPDEMKGDIARMVLYMTLRYEGENGEPDLELIESYQDRNSKTPYLGKKSTILLWHYLDPVSNAERKRNDLVFGYQKNRNPFIDRPEFVSLLFPPEVICQVNKQAICPDTQTMDARLPNSPEWLPAPLMLPRQETFPFDWARILGEFSEKPVLPSRKINP